jgi:hypothetical protein
MTSNQHQRLLPVSAPTPAPDTHACTPTRNSRLYQHQVLPPVPASGSPTCAPTRNSACITIRYYRLHPSLPAPDTPRRHPHQVLPPIPASGTPAYIFQHQVLHACTCIFGLIQRVGKPSGEKKVRNFHCRCRYYSPSKGAKSRQEIFKSPGKEIRET